MAAREKNFLFDVMSWYHESGYLKHKQTNNRVLLGGYLACIKGWFGKMFQHSLNGKPLSTQYFYSLYVIVAEKAELYFTDGGGRQHVGHSHLKERVKMTSSEVQNKLSNMHLRLKTITCTDQSTMYYKIDGLGHCGQYV